MKIVLGMDDSHHSEAASRWVRETGWPAGTRVVIVSVPQVVAYVLMDPAGAGLYEEIHQEQLQNCRNVVERAVAEFRTSGLTAEGRVEHGDAREAIVRIAEAERADLVVVGSHGRTGLPRLLMGSVASHVVNHAPCTVVVVKRPRARA